MKIIASNQKRRKEMNSNRKIARIAGVLFITATVASILGNVGFLNPILNNPDYLIKIFANENRVILGALFLLIAAFASAGIAISLYPILRRYNEGLALGSVGFRIIEGVFYIIGAISVLLLLTLSQEFVKAGAPVSSYFQTSGVLLLAVSNWANLTGILAFYLGALMYYSIFYQSKLIPRWLAGWGFVGATLGLVASMLVLFGLIGQLSTIQVVLNLPIGVQEMVLAVWLIVKGFNPSAIASGSAKGFHTSAIASESA
jgi:hypothetical protein